jgi:hypothetical protein
MKRVKTKPKRPAFSIMDGKSICNKSVKVGEWN